MERIYVVHWGSASFDDDGNAKAFADVHGVYTTKSAAQFGLNECKEQAYNEIVNNPDYDESDIAEAMKTTRVYGSVEDGYFEIDYTIGDTPCEIYITITEQ